ncbi:glycine betaine ABC transporter substrate-binding protein [Streptomyces sp. NBC_01795]|uniref:glycine betaine ABC transporter substrate-binding protein n=1 Tax=unclassified Streptomyces TaxID=2593676 RepID=UPI003FA34BEA
MRRPRTAGRRATTRRATTRRAALCVALLAPAAGCGLVSGSPMTDAVQPGSIGRGQPLKGAKLTVTSKEFTEQIILGQIMGLAFKAAGAQVVDRTSIQGSIGAREAVRSGTADGMYEYTGTGWITYLGNTTPVVDPHKQWLAVRKADRANGITWLAPSRLNNTYALAVNDRLQKKYRVRTLSDVAALSKKQRAAATVCVENEFASRDDGLTGMKKKYGMDIPSGNVSKMSGGVVYTQASQGSPCAFGEVFTTDGRIKAMRLNVLRDDRNFFPNYNAAPEMNAATMKKYPRIAQVLAPVTRALNNKVARELNAKVDVEGQDPHQVAKDWMVEKGFLKAS